MKNLRQFMSLYATNLFGVMNDNLLKILVCFVAATWVSDEYKSLIVNSMAGAMVLPYVIFSPLAGRLPHFFRKQAIVKTAKIFEIPIMCVAVAGFYCQNIALAMSAVTLMGFQSALFSPSKYGLIKDIGGVESLSMGIGGMEAVAFVGMLVGTFIGSVMSDYGSVEMYSIVIISLAIAGLLSSLTINVEETVENEETSANPIKFLRDTAALVRNHKGLNHVICFLSLFWWLSASIQLILVIHCEEVLEMSKSGTGYLMAIMAIGITLGCLISGKINQKNYFIGKSYIIGITIGILLILVFALPFQEMGECKVWIFGAFMIVVAILGGLMKIPLDAEIQRRVKTEELNIVLAYFNLVSFIFIFGASATNILITKFLPTNYVFLFNGLVMLIWSIVFVCCYRGVLCYTVRKMLHLHYDVQLVNREVIDVKDGENVLVMPMHRALLDPIMMFGELYDYKLQPLVDERFFSNKSVKHILGLFDSVRVPDLRTGGRAGVEQVQKLDSIVHTQLEKGSNIIFYPSGHVTMDGKETIGNRRMAYNACKNLPDCTRVILVEIHGLWGSLWSNYGVKKTPPLMRLLSKSLQFIFTFKFLTVPKRKVKITFTDMTAELKEWSQNSRQDFNRKLEDFYNRTPDTLEISKKLSIDN